MIKVNQVNQPSWRAVTIKMKLPVELKKLEELADNLWWVWNFEVQDLFRKIDPELWRQVRHNPVVFLDSLTFEQLNKLASDVVFMEKLFQMYASFRAYMDE